MDVKMRVWRGDANGGELKDYLVNAEEGMVVLDVIHRIQATQAPDMAVRWNCKAGKCGSCSAEVNGKPRLMCMTRMNTFEPGEPITVVIDDTLFKRWGRTVYHAFWTHDGAAQGGKKIARGNRWVIAGIVVRLPLCTAPVCLPVLMRLWAGKGSTSPVELAAQLLKLITAAFPDRDVHGVGDAAVHPPAPLHVEPELISPPEHVGPPQLVPGGAEAHDPFPAQRPVFPHGGDAAH